MGPVRPVFEAGRYAEAAALGRDLIELRPDQAFLFYNTACCESLAGETEASIEHLCRAIEMDGGWETRLGLTPRARFAFQALLAQQDAGHQRIQLAELRRASRASARS